MDEKIKRYKKKIQEEANESVHHALLPAAGRKRAGLVAAGWLCINIPLGWMLIHMYETKPVAAAASC